MCLNHTSPIPAAEPGAFAERLLGMLNGGALTMMISIGHRTGLFDALGDGEATTSRDLAQKAELSERYVREWLSAMTTGGIIRYQPATKTYQLPAEHGAWLTRAAIPHCFASTAQWISVLGAVENEVVAAFRDGRGVPYSAYKRFSEVMAEESGQTSVAALDDHILPLVPGLVEKLGQGIRVVDVGCGCGQAILHLAKRFPQSRFVGLDLLDAQIAVATVAAEKQGIDNAEFRACDVTNWHERSAYDLVLTFDAIHDQARPDLVLGNIAAALKSDGLYLMQDIKAATPLEGNLQNPLAPFIYTISCMHCMSVSLANGGVGLGAAWGKELALQMLGDAGFARTQVHELPHDLLNYYYLSTK